MSDKPKENVTISPNRRSETMMMRRVRNLNNDASFDEDDSNGLTKSLRAMLGTRKRRAVHASSKVVRVGVIVGESDAQGEAYDSAEENSTTEWMRMSEKQRKRSIVKENVKMLWKCLHGIVMIDDGKRNGLQLHRANGRLV
mmetsp:Transcript_22156/g.33605  ORF Transcript_22156/g.33605 Transcript_22156/m.33605 type:complete len:141 (-) Transcript_22156:348-770(-)